MIKKGVEQKYSIHKTVKYSVFIFMLMFSELEYVIFLQNNFIGFFIHMYVLAL